MKRIITGQIYYSKSYLIGKVNLSARTVEKWNDGKILEGHENWFCLESIPIQSRQKIAAFESTEVLQLLADTYNQGYAPYLPKVIAAGVKPAKCKAKAKEWTLLDMVVKLINGDSETGIQKITIAQAFNLYTTLKLPKAIINYYSFTDKLAKYRRNQEAAIIDGKTGKKATIVKNRTAFRNTGKALRPAEQI